MARVVEDLMMIQHLRNSRVGSFPSSLISNQLNSLNSHWTPMVFCKLSVLAGAAVLVGRVSAVDCPVEAVSSCTDKATELDSCCVPRPGGLFVFRQRFEPDEGDEGRWGIDGLDVLK